MENDKYIPENWVKAFDRDCRNLVKKNLGINIEGSFDIVSNQGSETIKNFNLVVKAMKIK